MGIEATLGMDGPDDIWVGKHYGRAKPQILILGESTYLDANGRLERLREYIPRWLSGSVRDHTFTRLSNCCGLGLSRAAFWASIVFYNFVVRAMANRNERPSDNDFRDSVPHFKAILAKHKPDGVFIVGITNGRHSLSVAEQRAACIVAPHPAAYGVSNDQLKAKWVELQDAVVRRRAGISNGGR